MRTEHRNGRQLAEIAPLPCAGHRELMYDRAGASEARRLMTASGNLLWSPVPAATIGAELIYSSRETQAGESTHAVRLQLAGRYSF